MKNYSSNLASNSFPLSFIYFIESAVPHVRHAFERQNKLLKDVFIERAIDIER